MDMPYKGTYFYTGLFKKILLINQFVIVLNMLSGERIKAHRASCFLLLLCINKSTILKNSSFKMFF